MKGKKEAWSSEYGDIDRVVTNFQTIDKIDNIQLDNYLIMSYYQKSKVLFCTYVICRP